MRPEARDPGLLRVPGGSRPYRQERNGPSIIGIGVSDGPRPGNTRRPRSQSTRFNSTRRFMARPSAVLLVATGRADP